MQARSVSSKPQATLHLEIAPVEEKLSSIINETRLYFAQAQSTTHIQQTLLAGQSDLAAYDKEIIRVQAVLDDLYKKREQLVTYLQACKSQLAPIRRLPFELLNKIFLLVYQDSLSKSSKSASSLPILLSNVCVGWRDVAYATPHIWNQLDVHFPSLSTHAVGAIRSRLQRSRNTSLSLNLTGTFSSDTLSVCAEVLEYLLRESHRWQHLHFELFNFETKFERETSAHLDRILSHSGIRSLPALESLSLPLSHPRQDSLFLSAPRLRTLKLRGSVLETEESDVSDPDSTKTILWPALDNLEVRSVEIDDFLAYIRNDLFRGLHSLTIRDMIGGFEPDDYVAEFPHLSSFSIVHHDVSSVQEMLEWLSERFRLPVLTSLKVLVEFDSGLESDEEFDEEQTSLQLQLCDFLLSSNCTASLSRLYLKGISDALPVLRILPNLITLTICEVEDLFAIDDPLLHALHDDNDMQQDVLVPNLRNLELKFVHHSPYIITSVVDMIRSRWSPGDGTNKLRKVKIVFQDEGVFRHASSDVPCAEKLKRDGFDISIFMPDGTVL
ncbi:hypothetical protein VKT23_015763 [Stygiomarasmius scandens]|uniref:F-box domain-containing protein n=1 Tax=Marasmiellus scandens TaxID=2682957 RepID=A0ABR1J0Z4_9AGAR